MRLPISWLRDWVETDATPEAVADALTRRGFYVEGIESHGHAYPGVVVARVLDVARHPNADKLSLCRVDSGAGELRVVCGAPNVRAGMIAPLATVGAKLPNGLTIKKSKIRGEESQGMLCSADELALSDDHSGIVDLAALRGGEAGLVIGGALDDLFGPPDTLLEIEVPFNRPDGLGVVGLAREVKAALGGRWTPAASARLKARWSGRADLDLELEDSDGCPRYIAQAVEGVTVGPSPAWIVRRLEAMGQRSINNVVDLTNLVLFEFGQPVHAFDLDRLAGPAIRVRRAAEGERLTTLDGKERALTPEVLVIADRQRPVAVAGVMGGADSEVSAATPAPAARVRLVQAAARAPRARARSASPPRPPSATSAAWIPTSPPPRPRASSRCCASSCRMRGSSRRARAQSPRRQAPHAHAAHVALRAAGRREPRRSPGPAPPAEALEFGVEASDPLRVTVPSWRLDVTLEDDLVEEVARAHGYDRIPEAPLETHGRVRPRARRASAPCERAREAMLARGLSEAWTASLVSEREALACRRAPGEAPRRWCGSPTR